MGPMGASPRGRGGRCSGAVHEREPRSRSPRLQRVRCPAHQTPGHARGRVLKIDRTIHASLCHRCHNDRAKPAPLRRTHLRPIALRPAHREGLALGPPADIQTTCIPRQRLVFTGVGGKFVEREPDGLRGSCVQTQFGAAHHDTRTKKIGEGRDLGANQALYLDTMPFTFDERSMNSGSLAGVWRAIACTTPSMFLAR